MLTHRLRHACFVAILATRIAARRRVECVGEKVAMNLTAGTDRLRTCMGVFLSSGFLVCAGSLFGAERPFLVPSPAFRFAERAERCQGTEMLAQLSGLPLSVACVFAAP